MLSNDERIYLLGLLNSELYRQTINNNIHKIPIDKELLSIIKQLDEEKLNEKKGF